ncbi:MAG: hypothetical protein OXC14_12415, partial [Rhodospirillaceae bacterium]|nr:hypothetical protein [Rhodospirillaceae bacterium]
GEGDAVALSPAFRETFDRHGALMKQAASFRRRPQVFERLLTERADIGQREIEELGEVHARAGKYLRSVTARTAHAVRQDAPHEEPGIVEAISAETAAPAAKAAPEEHAPSRTVEEVAAGPERDVTSDWRTLYKELQQDWNDLVARSEEPSLPLLLMDGYDGLIRRVHALADNPGLSEHARNVFDKLLDYHDEETAAQEIAEGYLAAAERHVEAYKVLERMAGERNLPVFRLDAWPEWRQAAEMLAATGKAVLSDDERYGAYLDAMTIGKARAKLTVEQLHSRLRENRIQSPKSEIRRPRREAASKQEEGFAHLLDERRQPGKRAGRTDKGEQQGFAHILDDPEKLQELREKTEQQNRKRGRHLRRSQGLRI